MAVGAYPNAGLPNEMGEYDPEEILFIVQGEMEYADTLDGEE